MAVSNCFGTPSTRPISPHGGLTARARRTARAPPFSGAMSSFDDSEKHAVTLRHPAPLAVPAVSPLVSGIMAERAPIHLGSGEPMLLLHPFMMSQNVWKKVRRQIAETGRYEVFAPTMPGHNGGIKGRFFLDTAELADDMERRLDALGWDTAHIVGNSLGGWVAFELERRGRARTLTGIAPAGGWRGTPPRSSRSCEVCGGNAAVAADAGAGPASAGAALRVGWPPCRSADPRGPERRGPGRHHRRRRRTAPPTTSCW